MEIIEYFIMLLMLGINAILAFFVLLKSKNHIIKILYFFLATSLSVWGVITFLIYDFDNLDTRLLLTKLDYTLAVFPVCFFLIFSLNFPKPLKKQIKSLISLFIIPLFFGVLSFFSNFIVKGVEIDGDKIIISIGRFHGFYSLFIYTYILAGSIILIKKYVKSSGISKLQIFYFGIGIISTAIILVVDAQVLPYFGIYEERINLLSILLFTSLAAYAIIRYRFMDIKVIIRRSSIYITTVVIALFIYAALIFLFQTEIFSKLNLNSTTATLISTALIIAGVPLIQKITKRIIEKVFTKEEYDPQKALDELEKSTIDNQSQNVIEKVEEIIKKQLGVESVKTETKDFNNDLLNKYLNERGDSVIVKEELEFIQQRNSDSKEILEKLKLWFKYNQSDVGVILQNQNKIIGVVLLGPKENKKPYSVQDIEFLNQFQVRISIVLANTLLYESTISQLKK